jgi:hypothetical protein
MRICQWRMWQATLSSWAWLERPCVSTSTPDTKNNNNLLFASVRAGIRDRSEGYVVTDLSFPTYLYDKYTANPDDLEEGLFKSKILIQVCRTSTTSQWPYRVCRDTKLDSCHLHPQRTIKCTFSKLQLNSLYLGKNWKESPRIHLWCTCSSLQVHARR